MRRTLVVVGEGEALRLVLVVGQATGEEPEFVGSVCPSQVVADVESAPQQTHRVLEWGGALFQAARVVRGAECQAKACVRVASVGEACKGSGLKLQRKQLRRWRRRRRRLHELEWPHRASVGERVCVVGTGGGAHSRR